MKKQEKAAEPSMEEILASIRKIIAEEPIGSRPEPARRNPRPVPEQVEAARDQVGAHGAPAPAHLGETRQGIAQAAGTVRRPIAIDDAIADLVEQPAGEAAGPVGKAGQGAPGPTAEPPGATPISEPRQRPSWLFSHPHAIPDVAPLTVGRHEPSRPTAPLPSPRDVLLSAVRAEPEPVVGCDKVHASPVGVIPTPKAPGGEAAPRGAPPEEAVDHGAAIARQPQGPGQCGGRVPSSGPEGSRLQRQAEPPTAEATPKSTATPGLPVCGTQSETPPSHCSDPAASEAAEPIALNPRTETVGPADRAVRPGAVTHSTAVLAESVDTTTVAAQSALNALSQGLAASAGTTSTAADDAADESSASAPAIQAVRTLEDTVADLLRPMLRQWLSANMPRIVETALRVELAEGVKPGLKTGPR
jgi:cell pole-organizing protein PopZ